MKGMIDMKIQDLKALPKDTFISSKQLMQELGLNSKELKVVMLELGYEPTRKYVDGCRCRGYVKIVEVEIEEDDNEYYTINECTLTKELVDIVDYMKQLYFFSNDDDEKYCLQMAKYSFKDSYYQLQVLRQ